MTTAWLMLAVGDARSHGGNDGYDDNPSQHYSWDSTVPNSENVAVGDVIALWDKESLLGVSVIEDIETGSMMKSIYTCPQCGKADFKPRVKKLPKYRCNTDGCKLEFEDRVSAIRQVKTFRTQHSAAWVDMAGVLPGRTLRALCDSPTSQLSMRPARWEKLRAALQDSGTPTTVVIADTAQKNIRGGHKQATVRVRVGQAAFRKKLLDEQGLNCAFTGPAPAVALEAAHLYSYADEEEHHSNGGLLLRRDVHRLFDLGLIACDPKTNTLDVASELTPYQDYFKLHGQPLTLKLTSDHRKWLALHWNMHRSPR